TIPDDGSAGGAAFVLITAVNNGQDYNAAVSFINTGRARNAADVQVTWDPAQKLLIFDISKDSKASDIVAALNRATGIPFTATQTGKNPTLAKVAVGGKLAGGQAQATWTEFGDGLPNAIVSALQYVAPQSGLTGSDVLEVGLRGRGVYELRGATQKAT